jgi:hypothetical protein
MATYTITFSETENWNDELHFKNLNSSSNGSPLARQEFERLRSTGCPFARLISWSHNSPTEIDRFGIAQNTQQSTVRYSLTETSTLKQRDSAVRIAFIQEPYTLCPVTTFREVWNAPECRSCGVYLWCIEYEGAYLVNYVGKTSDQGGFYSRLRTEWNDWQKGRYWEPVELEPFMQGRRTVTSDPVQRKRQVPELRSLFRIFLAPLSGDRTCRSAENEIVHRLRNSEITFQFLCNGDKDRKYPHEPAVEIDTLGAPPLIGLTSPIPKSLL